MWRRSQIPGYRFEIHSPRPIHRFVFLSLVFLLILAGSPGFAQDTVPPPPPDAQPNAQGENNVRAVRLSDVEGQVQAFQGDQVAFDQAQPNMPAVEGMRFVTGSNGRLEIEFEDGSVARVTPNSSIRLTELRRNAEGKTITQIDAVTGLSYYELNGRGGPISVHFGSDIATLTNSAVFRVTMDAAPVQLAVMHGTVHVDDGQGIAVDVHPNETFQMDPQQAGEYTVAQSINADSWDQWNSDRDHILADLESSQTMARASSGDPDNPAWNDLDYYGSWYNLPGYGQVWSPSGVSASWDPFGNGAWGYYPSFGYTWISGYPWGWWPYHCGAWDFLDGFGWIWVPGNCGWGFYGAGWYPYATVWRVPRGYTPPPRPRRGPMPGPRPHPTPLVAVNRGEEFSAPFRFDRNARPEPRVLNYEGKTIAPVDAGIHPIQRGPVGEGFTAAMVRTYPQTGRPAVIYPGMPGGVSSGFRSDYVPSINSGVRTFGAPPSLGASRAGGFSAGSSGGAHSSFSGSAGGGGVHMSTGGGTAAPASSGGGSPHH